MSRLQCNKQSRQAKQDVQPVGRPWLCCKAPHPPWDPHTSWRVTTQVEDRRGQLYSMVPHKAAWHRPQGTSPAGRGCGPALEAVGRVGDPVGSLLLGALGRAVACKDGLVGFGFVTVRDGPLQGSAWGFPSFPVSC